MSSRHFLSSPKTPSPRTTSRASARRGICGSPHPQLVFPILRSARRSSPHRVRLSRPDLHHFRWPCAIFPSLKQVLISQIMHVALLDHARFFSVVNRFATSLGKRSHLSCKLCHPRKGLFSLWFKRIFWSLNCWNIVELILQRTLSSRDRTNQFSLGNLHTRQWLYGQWCAWSQHGHNCLLEGGRSACEENIIIIIIITLISFYRYRNSHYYCVTSSNKHS